MAVVVRLRHDQSRRTYVERRTQEGPSKMKIMRCLKHCRLREVYRTPRADVEDLSGA